MEEGEVVMNRDNLERYLIAMSQAKKLLFTKVLTPSDYAKIDTIMAEKYSISSCSIYRPNILINKCISGNISYYKEVDYGYKY